MAGLFGKPKTPEIKPPAPMPDENDPGILASRRRRIAGMMDRGGRRSTILSEGMGGGEDYSKSRMG